MLENTSNKDGNEKESNNDDDTDNKKKKNIQESNIKKQTFLNWINRFNNNSNCSNNNNKNNNNNNNCGSSNYISNCNFKTKIIDNQKNQLIDEYKGVQGLKEFWNNHITLTKNKQIKSSKLDGVHKRYSSLDSNLEISKSINCLFNDRSLSFDEQIETNNYCCVNENHLKSDNFYKYKNSSTKKRLSLNENVSDIFIIDRRQTKEEEKEEIESKEESEKEESKIIRIQKVCGIGTNFPLIAATSTGEKIHWVKREDILMNRKFDKDKDKKQQQQQQVDMNTIETQLQFKNKHNIVIISDKTTDKMKNSLNVSHTSISHNPSEMETIKSSIMTDICNVRATNEISNTDKTDSGKSHNGSTNSLSSDSPIRKRNPASRKCSFKTHTKTYYGVSKKMSNYSSGSKVAALTHQFNQLVQKDAAILEEIKKKNGILISRAGHVYKIKEENENNRKKILKKDIGSGDDVSLKSGKRKLVGVKKNNVSKILKQTNEISANGNVKATVRKFEKRDENEIEEKQNEQQLQTNVHQKPRVPLKSEQVLQRTREIVLRNNQKKMKSAIETVASKIENQSKIIEEVLEETKNVVDVDSLKIEIIKEPKTISSNEEEISIKPNLNEVTDCSTDFKDKINSYKLEEEENKNNSKCIRLYDKYRIHSSFDKKQNNLEKEESLRPEPELNGVDKKDEQPEQKIIDALETINKKLEHLSKSTNDICVKVQSDEDRLYEELKANMKPNNSFLFRGNSRQGLLADGDVNSKIIIEAVNSRLINKTQSMDETNFSNLLQIRQISLEEREYPHILKKIDQIIDEFKHPKDEDDNHYEPIMIRDNLVTDTNNTTQTSFLYKEQLCLEKDKPSSVPVPNVPNDTNVYQTVAEAKAENMKNRNSVCSYESVENYELVPDDVDEKCEKLHENSNDQEMMLEDGYDVCDPPEPPPPRKSEGDIRKTSDELPPLPAPKRIFSDNNNFKIDSGTFARNKTNHQEHKVLENDVLESRTANSNENHDDEHCYDDENIYDTIKGSETLSHCYESLNSKHISSLDIVSVSNCYESIGSLRRNIVLRHSDSISTLSSDQKTNSLYGMTLGLQRSSLVDGSSDDNSDEWVDISDGEEDCEQNRRSKQQFIVVRERAKCHRSPDWSKRVRDQRIQQQIVDYIDDDSDHYYEPLYARGDTNENQTKITKATANDHRPQLTSLIMPNTINYHQQQQQQQQSKASAIAENSFSDDYDSFNTDEESDEEIKKNDSGVDISNTKLPDPPPTTNQVYAFVKKVKNFISNKKISSSRSSDNTTKPYENTQFYVSIQSPEYQNTSTIRSDKKNKSSRSGKIRMMKSTSKTGLPSTSADDLYENTEFHTPRIPINVTTITQTLENTSSPLTVSAGTITPKLNETVEGISNPPEIITRKKSKSGKSFKSKLRKSLGGVDSGFNIGGNTLNTTRSTFYISDSVDVDSGIFEKNPSSDTNLSPAPSTEQCDNQKSATVVTRKTKKNNGSPELNRRRTTIGIRPNNPPPPPPVDKKSQKKRTPTTSWYAECGVFKPTAQDEDLLHKDGRGERSSSTSWYAEAGLYQTSGASVASSSGSSGVSTGGEGGPGDDNSHSMFSNEPLYQIYSAAKLESISRDMEEQDSTDGYEEIGTHAKPEEQRKFSRPSALQLVGPKQGPSRTLWSEIPEVVNSGILGTLTTTEKRLQEAKFEILTSEASYLKSLNLLKTHFMNHPAFRDTTILSSSDRKSLFSCIVPVHECSDRFLCDLENCWQDNIMLLGLSKSVYKHADKYFHVYISFCENQGKMDRTLRKLKENKSTFSQTLDMLETDPVCCGLNLHSFLMLPMQRITRLPLLIDAVFSKVKPDDDEYEDWKITLATLNKIVSLCNDAANRCEQAYEIEKISRQIEFPSNIRSLAIAPFGIPVPGKKPRALVKKGELIHLIWRGDDAKLTFGKKFTKSNIFLFLFTDLLVFTKKKNDDQYTVFDYCPRSMTTISSGDAIPQLPTKEISQSGKNLFLLTLLENHERKTIEMILSCPSVSEQQRWLEALSPPESENPDEKLYEQWDCPQVIAKHQYSADEPDLLNLEPGDVVNVTRKMADGWYQGERIRDGATGWFPGSYTEEVNSPHVRARNLKQRYRLLTFTASYLETIKRNKS